jgi:hypothetical protein
LRDNKSPRDSYRWHQQLYSRLIRNRFVPGECERDSADWRYKASGQVRAGEASGLPDLCDPTTTKSVSREPQWPHRQRVSMGSGQRAKAASWA